MNPANTTTAPARAYINISGESITLKELARILDEAYDVGQGIRMFCKSQLRTKDLLTMEGTASLIRKESDPAYRAVKYIWGNIRG